MYRYRCERCGVETPPLADVGELYAARDRHRDEEHGGLIPDGERLSYRAPLRPAPDWRIPYGLAAAAVVVTVLGWLAHHL